MGSEDPRARSRGAAPADEPTTPVGLCHECEWVRIQETKRGARFFRCARADEDDSFMRYPPIPVLRCAGFVRMAD